MLLAIDLELYVSKPLPLISWSGAFVSMLARNVVKCVGEGLNLVAVSPLVDKDWRPVLSGRRVRQYREQVVLEVGTNLRTRITYEILSESTAIGQHLITCVQELLSRYGLEVAAIEFKFLDKHAVDDLPRDVPHAQQYLLSLQFYPTIFVFRGWRVLYPSPSRLIYSLARAVSKHYELRYENMKKLVHKLTRYIELLRDGTGIVELEIGSNRTIKAFWGEVLYGVYGYENMSILRLLLSLGEIINVGKSRGIGFGSIKLLHIKPL